MLQKAGELENFINEGERHPLREVAVAFHEDLRHRTKAGFKNKLVLGNGALKELLAFADLLVLFVEIYFPLV